MKGVIASRAPGIPVVDVTHDVPPQNVVIGAVALRAAARYFPKGTVHVAVVDPGVGTARRAVCIDTTEALFVGPDNGVLSLAAPPDRVRRAVEIANPGVILSPTSATFHGRDVFAPAAAALASGLPMAALGPSLAGIAALAVPTPVQEAKATRGEVVYVDRFGNLATNLDATILPAEVDHVEIASHRAIGFVRAYAEGPRHALVALLNSWGVLEIALRDGDARAVLGVGVGAAVTVVGR